MENNLNVYFYLSFKCFNKLSGPKDCEVFDPTVESVGTSSKRPDSASCNSYENPTFDMI